MLNSSSPTARKRLPLHIKVLLGFVLGGLLGLAAHFYAVDAPLTQHVIAYVTKPLGQIFLNLLFMLVIPLMFSALVLGVGELGDIASLGRLGWKTLMYTAAVTGMAVGIGLVMVNLIQPGAAPGSGAGAAGDGQQRGQGQRHRHQRPPARRDAAAGEHRAAQRRRRRGRRQADARASCSSR